jgi:hypothetical protein
MSKLLTSRGSILLAATLFVAASWFTASSDVSAPTSLVLSQPAAELHAIASR